MAYSYKEFTYLSGDGKSHIAACLYTPAGRTARGVVQLVHGMCDYTGRYHDLAVSLAEAGYAVCGGDLLGHGKTARHSDDLGFFAAEEGADTLVTDMHKLTLLMHNQFNGSPVILLGHGMGSLLCRLYASSYYRDIDGLILLGTTSSKLAGPCRLLAELVARRYGPNHRSEFLTKLVFGRYNRRVRKDDPAGIDWYAQDETAVTERAVDPLCAFTFTTSAYIDLFGMVERVSSAKYAEGFPKSLPVLIASGAQDPVGHYGRAPRLLSAHLTDAGAKDVTLKLYPGARHELFKDLCRQELADDLVAWLSERT